MRFGACLLAAVAFAILILEPQVASAEKFDARAHAGFGFLNIRVRRLLDVGYPNLLLGAAAFYHDVSLGLEAYVPANYPNAYLAAAGVEAGYRLRLAKPFTVTPAIGIAGVRQEDCPFCSDTPRVVQRRADATVSLHAVYQIAGHVTVGLKPAVLFEDWRNVYSAFVTIGWASAKP